MSSLSRSDDSFIAHLAAICDRILTASGVPNRTVNRAVVELMSEVRSCFGGEAVYIPKGRVPKGERAAEVHGRHAAGETIAELAKSYGFAPVYVGQLIALEQRRLQDIRRNAEASARRQRAEKHHG